MFNRFQVVFFFVSVTVSGLVFGGDLSGTWKLQDSKCSSGGKSELLTKGLVGDLNTVLVIDKDSIMSNTKYTAKIDEASVQEKLKYFNQALQMASSVADPYQQLKYLYEINLAKIQYIEFVNKNKDGISCESNKGAYYKKTSNKLVLTNFFALSTCDEGLPDSETEFDYEFKDKNLTLTLKPKNELTDVSVCPASDSFVMVFKKIK